VQTLVLADPDSFQLNPLEILSQARLFLRGEKVFRHYKEHVVFFVDVGTEMSGVLPSHLREASAGQWLAFLYALDGFIEGAGKAPACFVVAQHYADGPLTGYATAFKHGKQG
jgi:hypothetical protein